MNILGFNSKDDPIDDNDRDSRFFANKFVKKVREDKARQKQKSHSQEKHEK